MEAESEERGRGCSPAAGSRLHRKPRARLFFSFPFASLLLFMCDWFGFLSYHVCLFCSWGLVRRPQENRPEINTSPALGLPDLFLVFSSEPAPPPPTSVLVGAPARAERSWGMGDAAKLAPAGLGLALWVR